MISMEVQAWTAMRMASTWVRIRIPAWVTTRRSSLPSTTLMPTTLPSALKNVLELLRRGKKIIVAVNMVKELLKRGGKIDFNRLESLLGCPVVYGEFNTNKDIKKIKTAIQNYKQPPIKVSDEIFKNLSSIYIAPAYAQSALDRLTTNKITAIPIFIMVISLTFYLAFGRYGVGTILSDALKGVFDNVCTSVNDFLTQSNCNEFIKNVVALGVLNALSGVLSFLPQTIVIYAALVLLEESGYMSRLAYISENLLSKTGLNGRAVFSIFMGFGCTALSVASSGGLENVASRKRVALISTFIPCTAKIPVISYLSSFSKSPFLFVLAVYFLGVIIAVIEVKIFNAVNKGETRLPLVIELPPYRIPTLKNYVKALIISINLNFL